MTTAAYKAFKRVLKKGRGAEPVMIDGYSHFLFLNRNGLPKVGANYDSMFQGLVKKYNKCHEEPLPKITTPHTMRHTFCTNVQQAGLDVKSLQYLMGHSNASVTLDVYTHSSFDSVERAFEQIASSL